MVAIKNATVFVSLLIQIILVDFINGGTKKGIESIEKQTQIQLLTFDSYQSILNTFSNKHFIVLYSSTKPFL